MTLYNGQYLHVSTATTVQWVASSDYQWTRYIQAICENRYYLLLNFMFLEMGLLFSQTYFSTGLYSFIMHA